MFKSRTLEEKSLLGPKVSRRRGEVLQGLHIKHASDGSVERNMELALDQRRRYENVINKTHNGSILRCKFYEPREGKIDGFSYLKSLKKHKRRLQWGTFFEGSLVGSKKG
jgi:N12 class adenine-specific DNA methylase